MTLGNISLCGTALDRTLLLTSNGAGLLQVIGHVGNTTHELAMIAGALGACRNQIRDGAAIGEQGIGNPRITAINNNGGTQIRIGTIILGRSNLENHIIEVEVPPAKQVLKADNPCIGPEGDDGGMGQTIRVSLTGSGAEGVPRLLDKDLEDQFEPGRDYST